MKGRTKAGVLALGLAVAAVAQAESPQDPQEVAARVAADNGFPESIVIGVAPRWTPTQRPAMSAGGGGWGGGRPYDVADDAGLGPQRGGGQIGDANDGWDSDGWAEPAPRDPDVVPGGGGGGHGGGFDVAGVGMLELAGGGAGFGPGPGEDSGGEGAGDAGRGHGAGLDDAELVFDAPTEIDAAADIVPEPTEVEPEPEPEVEPEPEPEPEVVPEPEPEPEAEVEPEEEVPDPVETLEAAAAAPALDPVAEPAPEEEVFADDGPDDAGNGGALAATDFPESAPTRRARQESGAWRWWLLALGTIVALVITVIVTRRTVRAVKRPSTARSSNRTPSPVGTAIVVPPAVPDAVDFEAQIRALLRAALVNVGWRPEGRDLAVTAREVLAGIDGRDPRRPPLRDIVGAAEAVVFAGRGATAELYARAHGAFLALCHVTGGTP